MGQPAMRQTDKIIQQTPHCHAPIHPPAPVPTPVPHPGLPLAIVSATSPNVKINSLAAAMVMSMSEPCKLPSCVPAGPGLISMGSATVIINILPAARLNDMTAHASCVAPIPAPTGTCMGPGSSNVMIGG